MAERKRRCHHALSIHRPCTPGTLTCLPDHRAAAPALGVIIDVLWPALDKRSCIGAEDEGWRR